MNSADERVVQLSPGKVAAIVAGSFPVVAVGIWMFSLDETTIVSFRRLNSPELVHGFGLFIAAMGVLGGLYGVRRFFGDRRGVVFSSTGVTDYTSGISAGMIPWREIVGAEIVKLSTQTVLVIKLKEPRKFLEHQSLLRWPFLALNDKICGSPVAISPAALKVSPSELLDLFSQYREKYGNA
jgi:hypothetical protein